MEKNQHEKEEKHCLFFGTVKKVKDLLSFGKVCLLND